MNKKRHISDQEILDAVVPNDTLLVVSEGGHQCEMTFSALMAKKGERLNSTDFMLLSAALCYHGAGGYDDWRARVKSGPLKA